MNFLSNLKHELIKLDNDVYEDFDNDASEDQLSNLSPNALVNFYAKATSLRNKSEELIINLFDLAYKENPLKSIKLLFYIRDTKHGLGERRVFRVIVNYLGSTNNIILRGNLKYIPEFGRWDDVYAVFGTPLESAMLDIIKVQLKKDLAADKPSNMAKWLKSENASSKTSKQLGKITRKSLNMSSKQYRLILTKLRYKLNIIEQNISKKNYASIKYGNVPYCAMKKYSKTFLLKDKERFTEFLKLNHLLNSEERIGVSKNTMLKNTPFSIVENMFSSNNNNSLNENLWSELPNYKKEFLGDTLSIIGFSNDSQNNVQATDCFNGALGAVLYLMDKNKGRFSNYVITTSPNTNLKKIKSKNLKSRATEITNASFTNHIKVEEVLDVILYAAIKHTFKQEYIPVRLLFITDTSCNISLVSKRDDVLSPNLINAEEYENIKEKWAISGYDVPEIVIWTIDSKRNDSTIVDTTKSIKFAYGYSDKIFESIISGELYEDTSGLECVLKSSRYEKIKEYWK